METIVPLIYRTLGRQEGVGDLPFEGKLDDLISALQSIRDDIPGEFRLSG